MNTTIETIKCACGTAFQWDITNLDEFDIQYCKPKRCQLCEERLEAEREAREAKESAKREQARQEWIARNLIKIVERIDKATPELFSRTNTSHPKFNATAWDKIQNHELTEEWPWLGCVGMTGTCKTRIAYRFAANELKRLTDEQIPTFEFVASYEIGDAVGRLYGSDFEEKTRARDFLDRLREVDVLLIDDLGKGRLTPAVASELFALIDHRHAHIARTIWTSNSSPESIAAGLPEDMAGPFAGRIIESSKIFTFK